MNEAAVTRELLWHRSGWRCEIHTEGCAGDATDLHHRQRRGCGDDTITNALHVCRPCHMHAHAHPVEARANGWIVSSYYSPASQPVRIRGRWYLLRDNGSKDPAPDDGPP